MKYTTGINLLTKFQLREHFIAENTCANGIPVEADGTTARVDGAGDIFNPLAEFKTTGDLNPY